LTSLSDRQNFLILFSVNFPAIHFVFYNNWTNSVLSSATHICADNWPHKHTEQKISTNSAVLKLIHVSFIPSAVSRYIIQHAAAVHNKTKTLTMFHTPHKPDGRGDR